MRLILLLFLTISCPSARAINAIQDISELALLPTYCRGTQQIRTISGDTKPLEEYVAIYGEAFLHLQHYCWALSGENKLPKMRDENQRQSERISILGNIQYVLDRSPLNFSLLPEMYISKARILFKMDRDVEAIGVLFKLTQLRPDYGPAYDQLGDYYQRIGDKRSAIATYEQGILNSPKDNTAFFIKKIRKLDKNYKIRQPKERPAMKQAVQQPADVPAAASAPADTAPPAEPEKKPNPYCRFCP